MNIMVFDTETISVGKPYCYNIGYVIYDTDGKQILCKRDFVVEQVWNNRPLFDTAYYADKRPIYVSRMRGRQTEMSKYGFIQAQMIRDIQNYKVDGAYAFNSKFDDGVFEFNADRYGCRNALDTLPIYDIRGYAMRYLADLLTSSRFIFLSLSINLIDSKGSSGQIFATAFFVISIKSQRIASISQEQKITVSPPHPPSIHNAVT